MSDVVMPRLSDTMEEGTILRWLKQDGEQVARGEELVEIETDKATMTYESDREGVLRTVAREGDTLAVGDLIARLGGAETAANATDASESATPEPTTPSGAGAAAPAASHSNGAPVEPSTRAPERMKASPLARRVARETGVDLAGIHGSGPGGRIVKADIDEQSGATPVVPATTVELTPSPASDTPVAKGETTTVELTRTQRTIARRMAESKATIPDFTLTADVDMQECLELRAELRRLAHKGVERPTADDEKGGVAPTYNDMIVKACALALREYPRANGSYRDGRFELHSRVNVGVAVAVSSGHPTGGGLVVPTVFDADTKALGEIARETHTLAQRVRDGQVTPPELGGATFTVSNLGMYGIRHFSAIVNPPQAAILAVGEVASRPVAHKKKAIVRATMTLTLSCDHRILYGADAALFLARVRELLEEPAALTL
jgi:pyruvate dehydrogenase E2 component (dihydrolipoamide acetyltransferase)